MASSKLLLVTLILISFMEISSNGIIKIEMIWPDVYSWVQTSWAERELATRVRRVTTWWAVLVISVDIGIRTFLEVNISFLILEEYHFVSILYCFILYFFIISIFILYCYIIFLNSLLDSQLPLILYYICFYITYNSY